MIPAPAIQPIQITDLVGAVTSAFWQIYFTWFGGAGVEAMPHRGGLLIEQGGMSAGKTYANMQFIFLLANAYPHLRVTVAGVSIGHMEDAGPMADLETILSNSELAQRAVVNKHGTKRIYTLGNGSTIKFDVFPDAIKAKGGKRDILFVNELDKMPPEIFDLLRARVGRTESPISLTIVDYNPSLSFYIHQIRTDAQAEGNKKIRFIRLTYKDNEFCAPETVELIESRRTKDPEWFEVYGNGKTGKLEGLVFNYSISPIPTGATCLGYGMDFGFTNDPTTLVALWRQGDSIWWDQLLYQRGMHAPEIAQVIKRECDSRLPIYADGEDPRLIREINAHGLNVQAADKGPGSILFGVDIVCTYNLHITPRSGYTQIEVGAYMWPKDQFGNMLRKQNPVGFKGDHTIDAGRYISRHTLSRTAIGRASATYSPAPPLNPNN